MQLPFLLVETNMKKIQIFGSGGHCNKGYVRWIRNARLSC